MKPLPFRIIDLLPVVCMMIVGITASPGQAQLSPPPGSYYCEFAKHNGGNRDWRVTDRKAVEKFERASEFLPNPRIEIEVNDLKHAVRAELILDRWGGHRGTINKRIRFNDQAWIPVPELENVPDGLRSVMLMYQDNPVIEIPLGDLHEGINVFDADCDEEGGFGWGQWGIFSLILRVYYDAEAKGSDAAIGGKIVSPTKGETIADHPRIEISAEAAMGVARIDVLASYDGYDEDGDGAFGGFHQSRFQLIRGEANERRDHVATLWREPYRVTWDTHWLPDQPQGGVALVAHIQDSRGYWYITEIVEDLSLVRDDVSVRLYPARGMTEDHGVRAGETKECYFDLPADVAIDKIAEAAVHLRTWHGWDGHHDPIRINDHEMPISGKNHFYDYDLLEIPPSSLHRGENVFRIHSDTEHHQLELLWPGPALVTRSTKPDVTIGSGSYQDRDHFVIETRNATYWLDKHAGGLSRLIDGDGRDWIAFKREPWGEYPPSAGSAYRGIPNLLHGGSESGFGHPGWDLATSHQIDANTIVSTSHSGKWQLRWEFDTDEVRMTVAMTDGDRPYWFLYEGPIAGRWAPHEQYFATNAAAPITEPHDYFKGDKLFDQWQWAYFGDDQSPRVLFVLHEQADDALDTFAHLGNSDQGLDSEDGMVVFGFGRGREGIEPLLRGVHSFRIGLLEHNGRDIAGYEAIRRRLSSAQ